VLDDEVDHQVGPVGRRGVHVEALGAVDVVVRAVELEELELGELLGVLDGADRGGRGRHELGRVDVPRRPRAGVRVLVERDEPGGLRRGGHRVGAAAGGNDLFRDDGARGDGREEQERRCDREQGTGAVEPKVGSHR
jgi:hypothetical protein